MLLILLSAKNTNKLQHKITQSLPDWMGLLEQKRSLVPSSCDCRMIKGEEQSCIHSFFFEYPMLTFSSDPALWHRHWHRQRHQRWIDKKATDKRNKVHLSCNYKQKEYAIESFDRCILHYFPVAHREHIGRLAASD